MSIGDLLKQQRLQKGLTLEYVALEAGTDPGNLSRIERNVQQPSAALLRRLGAALDLSPALLYLDGNDPRQVREPVSEYGKDFLQLQCSFNALDSHNQRLALEFIQMLLRLQKNP
jgi:transcriptional regulator with XRE-family HTH domain